MLHNTNNKLEYEKILHITSSPKGENSFSIKLGNAIIDKIIAANPGSTVVVNDLTKHPFPHLEEATLAAFYTPAGNHTPENKEALKILTRQLQKSWMQTSSRR